MCITAFNIMTMELKIKMYKKNIVCTLFINCGKECSCDCSVKLIQLTIKTFKPYETDQVLIQICKP